MILSDVLKQGQLMLERASIDSFKLDARLLLEHITNKSHSSLLISLDEDIVEHQVQAYFNLIEKRAKGICVAYLVGYKDFWSLKLLVNEHTLVPRPDTELLVETCLNLNINGKVLDLGTGTGAIILSLKKERPNLNCFAVDFSKEALAVASENAKLNNLDVTFIHSSWFSNVKEKEFDFIVSNPPYIVENDPHLKDDGVKYEPMSALVSKDNGLYDIKKIVEDSVSFLKKGGYILFEHGYDQALAVKDILLKANFTSISCIKDYGGNDRVTLGKYQG